MLSAARRRGAPGISAILGLSLLNYGCQASAREPGRRKLAVPVTPPLSVVNRATLSMFNAAYYRRPHTERHDVRWHYRPFLYPLDGIRHWNRMYGPRGFYQYQCVVAAAHGRRRLGGVARAHCSERPGQLPGRA